MYIKNKVGNDSCICMLLKEHERYLHWARGASAEPSLHVADTVRLIVDEAHKHGYDGSLSAYVRRRLVRRLKGEFRPKVAEAYDRAQFPDGVPVTQ